MDLIAYYRQLVCSDITLFPVGCDPWDLVGNQLILRGFFPTLNHFLAFWVTCDLLEVLGGLTHVRLNLPPRGPLREAPPVPPRQGGFYAKGLGRGPHAGLEVPPQAYVLGSDRFTTMATGILSPEEHELRWFVARPGTGPGSGADRPYPPCYPPASNLRSPGSGTVRDSQPGMTDEVLFWRQTQGLALPSSMTAEGRARGARVPPNTRANRPMDGPEMFPPWWQPVGGRLGSGQGKGKGRGKPGPAAAAAAAGSAWDETGFPELGGRPTLRALRHRSSGDHRSLTPAHIRERFPDVYHAVVRPGTETFFAVAAMKGPGPGPGGGLALLQQHGTPFELTCWLHEPQGQEQ